MPTKEEIDSQIMDLWDEIFDLEDKSKEELNINLHSAADALNIHKFLIARFR